MTHTIPANLPISFQCLCVPAEWTRVMKSVSPSRLFANWPKAEPPVVEPDGDLLQVHRIRGVATSFDPWEKRNEFFRLKPGDSEALLKFLPSVGLLEAAGFGSEETDESWAYIRTGDDQSYKTRYVAKTSEKHIWGLQRLLMGSLKNLEGHTGELTDFRVRIVHGRSGPRVLLTTTTFLESLLLTLAVDKVQKAKVRKCARPDCGVLFSTSGGHKRKYCEWYCGHIESVRKARRKAQKTTRQPRQSSQTSVASKGN